MPWGLPEWKVMCMWECQVNNFFNLYGLWTLTKLLLCVSVKVVSLALLYEGNFSFFFWWEKRRVLFVLPREYQMANCVWDSFLTEWRKWLINQTTSPQSQLQHCSQSQALRATPAGIHLKTAEHNVGIKVELDLKAKQRKCPKPIIILTSKEVT